MRTTPLILCVLLSGLVGCDEPASREVEARRSAEATNPETVELPDTPSGLRLEVPPRAIARARQEAAGLARMPAALRAQTLARRREAPAPDYAQLVEDADAHAHERASFEGQVGFVRPAGPRLWILPLFTRRDGARWADPIYVLSTIRPDLPVAGGVVARADGWVVGTRTIGQNTLPLIVAYSVRADAGSGIVE